MNDQHFISGARTYLLAIQAERDDIARIVRLVGVVTVAFVVSAFVVLGGLSLWSAILPVAMLLAAIVASEAWRRQAAIPRWYPAWVRSQPAPIAREMATAIHRRKLRRIAEGLRWIDRHTV